MPGTPEFYELVRGPADLIDRNRIDVARRRWQNGGERAVMDWWDSPGERPWHGGASLVLNGSGSKRKSTTAISRALIALDLLEPEERAFLEAEAHTA